jgi:hypothetical protein
MRASELCFERAAEIFQNYDLKITEHKLGIESMKEQLRLMRRERRESELDMELQLVFKMGQAEVEALRGDVYGDLKGAIVVPRVDVERVNEAIIAAGKDRLSLMRRGLEFRRHIEVEQWAYDCVKTKVRHLQDKLYFARTANLTRETRHFLAKFSPKYKEDKTPQKMKREFEAMRKSQEKVGWTLLFNALRHSDKIHFVQALGSANENTLLY